jgi:hypothetical protein
METKVRVINTFFIPFNLFLKLFNYILRYGYMNEFDTKTFESKLHSEYISIIKVKNIPNETKYKRLVKEYKLWEQKYM